MWWLLTALALALPPQLRDAVRLGDCAAVTQALPAPQGDQELLAAGWCLARSDPRAAVAVLAQASDHGVLSEYARWQRARAKLASGDPQGALADANGELPGAAGLDLRLVRGRALVALGQSLEAREDLRALLDTEVGDAARYWLAVGGEDRGDTQAAIATYRRTWANSVVGPWSDLASQRVQAMGQPVPDTGSEAGRALVHERIDALARANQHDTALPLWLALDQATPLDTLTLARAKFRGRDYKGAVLDYQQALGPAEHASGKPRDLFDYALGTSRVGDYDSAALIYRRLIASAPQHRKADFASFKLGYLEYDRGDCAKALPLFAEHIRARPSSKHSDEALWFSSRCAYKLGDLDAMVGHLQALQAAYPSSKLVPGALYWQARVQGLQGHAGAERAGLSALLRSYPVSGYAWFAAQRLGKRFPQRPLAQAPAWPVELAGARGVQRANALLAVGLARQASDELRPVRRRAKKLGRDGALAAAWALMSSGDYKAGRRLAKPYCVRPWQGGEPEAQQACTPRPEASVVLPLARAYGLDVFVPFGVMTAESNLDPSVTSIAGARGLMQLMPAEAPRIHAVRYPGRPFNADDLYAAPYNASLGTTELGMKAQQLAGALDGSDLPAVIASYNGGVEAVQRWLGAYDSPPEPDVFAEDIGYTETRRYVQRVLGFVMAYRWTYGDPAPAAKEQAPGGALALPVGE